MFVGEAPGAEEDRQGLPFVGRAGNFLTELLEGIGMKREDVFIDNVLKCRPPGNRDPQPEEIDTCRPWLDQQVELIQPRMIGTLGNFATKLLTANPTGITKVRGTPQEHVIGGPLPVCPAAVPSGGRPAHAGGGRAAARGLRADPGAAGAAAARAAAGDRRPSAEAERRARPARPLQPLGAG